MSTWLFDSLLVTSLMMAVILMIRRPVAKTFGAGIAYMLWLIPAARLLVPSIAIPALAPVEGSQAIRDAVRESVLAGMPMTEPVVTTAGELVTPSIDWIALGLTVWLGGAALMFLIQMLRYASMRDELLAEAELIDVIDGVQLIASDRVGGPLAFGLLKRFIAVPENFAKAYPPAERELAIAHEMAHHKSRDLFANLAAFSFLCLQWFNPLAWASWRAFRFDQEAACDARVLAGKDNEARHAYGRALARTAFDGVPTFATALNSPKTILERLRRLTMKDASKKRQSFGKIGLITAAAIILPLSATFVPAMVKASEDNAQTKTVKKVKIIKMKDGETVNIEGDEGDGGFVKKVERDGKTFVFRTDHELSDAELEKMIAEAEQSSADANKRMAEADAATADADRATADADRQIAIADSQIAKADRQIREVRVVKDKAGKEYRMIKVRDSQEGGKDFDWEKDMPDVSMMVPEIDIREIHSNCEEGKSVTTNVEGFDGNRKSRVKIVLCGRGQAKLARLEAIKGLKEARDDIDDDSDMPKNVRKEVKEKLNAEIKKLEKQTDAD